MTLVQAGLLLKAGTAVDATSIPGPSSTKNNDGPRDPEMTPSKKGNNYYFGMKAQSADLRFGSGYADSPKAVPVSRMQEITNSLILQAIVNADANRSAIAPRTGISRAQVGSNGCGTGISLALA